MKSFCPFNSALVLISPLANSDYLLQNSFSHLLDRRLSGHNFAGVNIDNVGHAILRGLNWRQSYTTGAIGFPVGVPKPVVNSTTLAPAPTCAVTHSTSFPGVHCKFRPATVEYSG